MFKKFKNEHARLTIKLVGIVLTLAMLVGVAVMTATAQNPYGGWVIDGTVPDGNGLINAIDPAGNSKELGPVNASNTKLGVIHTAPPPMMNFTNPNGQVDFRQIWLGTGLDGNEDIWLYFAWERDSNKGSGVIMFEFQHNPMSEGCEFGEIDQILPIDEGEQALIDNCNPWANRQPEDFIIVWQQVGSNIVL